MSNMLAPLSWREVLGYLKRSNAWSLKTQTITSAVITSDDRLLDQRALMRWADDGGRWTGENRTTGLGVQT